MSIKKFPITESTLSARYLGKYLQESYKFGSETTCTLFRTGINHLYTITDGANKFVFRVYTLDWRTKLEIAEEVRLLLYLKENNIPVSYPVADRNNCFIQKFDAPEGLRFGVLFSFARGEKRSRFTPAISYNIGMVMGKMHRVTENFILQRITYSPETLLIKPLESARKFYNPGSEEMAFVERTTLSLFKAYEKVKTSELRYGAIHLDIWFDNMHFQDEDEITIFDFDFCGNGWLCYDIAYFMVQLFNTNQVESEYELKVKRFLEGYESITIISDEERRIIPFIAVSIWFYYLGIQCDKYDTWSNLFLNEDHLKRFIGTIKKWMTYNKLQFEE